MSEKEIEEQAEKMWLEYHGDYPPDIIPAMPPVYIRGFRDALRWIQGWAIYEAEKGGEVSGRGDDRTSMYGEAGTGIGGIPFRYVEKFAAPSDPVEHPAHYQQFGMEVIDIIRHVLGPEGFRAYCIGNELKYRLRAGDKVDAAQDLAKAQKYREFREGK